MSQNEQQLGSSAQFAFISSLSVIMPRFLSFFLKVPGVVSRIYRRIMEENMDHKVRAEILSYAFVRSLIA